MTQDLIRYDVLVQEALRGVVRKVIGEIAKTGLPGDHHFYISFDTGHPGVRLSGRLRQRYPSEMTIILQHQYWELVVNESWFEVGLSFSGIPEKLHVPFAAVKGFVDPSVEFGLQFEVLHEDAVAEAPAAEPEGPRLVPVEASTIPSIAAAPPAPTPAAAAEPVAEAVPDVPATATVLSLDKFRKKP
ncbi:hypothetical protein EYW49_08255 [Siculibacillus lacustris]|uniref:Stringent starvation protein B n=1 Tax=Siculibacillus lacustris TaxID=1549641 RepID=A0A4Q9VRV8_9HYPH|nr:ClpXP protease specificity-enhancing factor SspB [Siculibacillus lacustris]TBW38681.1 hypothetical protein EYW49_08255 [Siculibacillus lacustris]